jgi:hypothetical protein
MRPSLNRLKHCPNQLNNNNACRLMQTLSQDQEGELAKVTQQLATQQVRRRRTTAALLTRDRALSRPSCARYAGYTSEYQTVLHVLKKDL